METYAESSAAIGAPSRFRYLLDVVIFIAVVLGSDVIAEAIYTPKSMQARYVFGLTIQMLQLAFAWLLIRLRGETLADIGLKRPKSWLRTIAIGVSLAALVFVAIYFSEKAGFHRDLSRFAALQGNLILTLIAVVYVLIGAGFYEEFMFRGFLMQGFAMCFGGTRGAWAIACAIQGILFGLVHAYQNPLGMLIAGALGILLAVLVLVSGRNLWPAIIGHGVFDASRAILIYFQGPPGS